MADFTFGKGDTMPSLVITVVSATDAPLNLNGATATMRVRAEASGTNKFTVTGTIESATGGRIRFDWGQTHWDTVGLYYGELNLVYDDGNDDACPENRVTFEVLPVYDT